MLLADEIISHRRGLFTTRGRGRRKEIYQDLISGFRASATSGGWGEAGARGGEAIAEQSSSNDMRRRSILAVVLIDIVGDDKLTSR